MRLVDKFGNPVMKKILSIIVGATYSLLSFEIMWWAFGYIMDATFWKPICLSIVFSFIVLGALWLICTKLFRVDNKTFCTFFISAAYVMEVLILIYIYMEDGMAFLFAIWELTTVISVPIAILLVILFLIKRMKNNKNNLSR